MNIKLKAALQSIVLVVTGFVVICGVEYVLDNINPQLILKGLLIGMLALMTYGAYRMRLMSLEGQEILNKIKQLDNQR